MNTLNEFCREKIFLLAAVILSISIALSLTSISPALALEKPRNGEIERLKEQGLYENCLAFAKKLGNHNPHPGLVSKMQQKILELQGIEFFGPPWGSDMPSSGNVRIFALLIEFQDYTQSVSWATVNSYLYGSGNPANYPRNSLTDWYDRSSYGALDLSNGTTFNWYQTAYNRSSVVESDAGRDNLIKEVLNHWNSLGHDFSQYDNDGDGDIDYFIVYWTGPIGDWATFWWGYKTSFSDGAYTLDGKTLSQYSWQWESDNPDVVIHETGHGLGLPDYYDYDDMIGPDGGVGNFDMMDGGRWDHNCFSKWMIDWITPEVVSGSKEDLTLQYTSESNDDTCVLIWPAVTLGDYFSEYYLVQNRQNVGNDTAPDVWWFDVDGLAIWHVDATLNGAGTGFQYDNSYTSHKLLKLMQADGDEEIETAFCIIGGPADGTCSHNGWDCYVEADAEYVDGICHWVEGEDFYSEGDVLSHLSTPSSAKYDGSDSCVTVCDIVDYNNPAKEISASFSAMCSSSPSCDANGPYSAPCQGTGTAIQLHGTADDPDLPDETLEYLWTTTCPGGSFNDDTILEPLLTVNTSNGCLIDCSVTLTVTDCIGNTDSSTSTIHIEDITAPNISCLDQITVQCTGDCGIDAFDAQLDGFWSAISASDDCDPTPSITNNAPGFFTIGSTDVTFTVTDYCGNSNHCTSTVTVVDTIPPEIAVTLNRYELWPPNHKMVDIIADVLVEDICDPNASFYLVEPITSDEPDNGLGDGDQPNDIQGADYGTPDTEFQLRSERSGLGDGRTYTIVYTAYDACDTNPVNTTDATVLVEVPHDQSGHANSSYGFNSLGADFQKKAKAFKLVVLSTLDFNARTIIPSSVRVGNTHGTIESLQTSVSDLNRDGLGDFIAVFSVSEAQKLRKISEEDNPLAFRYGTSDGTYYLVPNIFALGPPL